ncbi:MAG: beta-hydroxyacyl-ACP dehydratase [Pyrinomonadaceae bacterium]|nr:beta-hydroxyacyl-ACP dehydratase [Phycisphaerales bacterium]
MHFNLVDAVVERSETRIVTVKQVSSAEEYLQDHFPGFPVLPGVMMVESIVQAARLLLEPRVPGVRLVLGSVRALKYGRFVRPGDSLRVEVTLHKDNPDGSFEVKAEGLAVRTWQTGSAESGPAAVAGRLVLRPVRMA